MTIRFRKNFLKYFEEATRNTKKSWITILSLAMITSLLLTGCEDTVWNNPYPFDDPRSNTLYQAFTERPKHLDPARSYTEPEWRFICQIYEPPLEYHYLKRPYELQPLTSAQMPEIHFFDVQGRSLPEAAKSEDVAFTEYVIQIQPGIYYQPHPAFAKNKNGHPLYLDLNENEAAKFRDWGDFTETGSRELTAEDYVYQIKRLADPSLSSPIYGVMSKYIVGLADLRKILLKPAQGRRIDQETDLRSYEIEGAKVIDRYTYRIKLYGKYPQFRFWLAMPFFAPIPWEAIRFYSQPGFNRRNISLDWQPIGTGPYQLLENNPNRRMVLVKNPNFRAQYYPTLTNGSEIQNSGEILNQIQPHSIRIPQVAKVNYTLERESIPFWNKFLQGYYDSSGISSDNFTSAIRFTTSGSPELSSSLQQKQIRLQTSVSPSIFMWGFNMLDDTVGGNSPRALALRRAISLAFDIQEFIDIFLNGRGIQAFGPIPKDIFGYSAQPFNNRNISEDIRDINDLKIQAAEKAAKIKEARAILKQAGIKPGMVVYLDAAVSGEPNEIATHAWLTEQFKKINLRMVMRGTHYNRYQEKMRQGNTQIFFWGWNADYPDPENFLFLFYGPNGAALFGGENQTNYQNKEYDQLFEKMRAMEDGPERLDLITQMVKILNRDQPVVWGFYPKTFGLQHHWMQEGRPTGIINNTLKYVKLEPELRAIDRQKWNMPIQWPIWVLGGFFIMGILGVVGRYYKKEYSIRGRV